MRNEMLAVYTVAIVFILFLFLCGGAIRGCSNDFDRASGNPKTFKWWAW